MAKERKTKRQKLLSDKRHSKAPVVKREERVYNLETSGASFPIFTSPVLKTAVISTADYEYLVNDIKKIAIVTGVIILSELGIYWTSVGF